DAANGGSKDLIADKTNGDHGQVSITNANTDLTYTPNADYCGTDSFTYKLNNTAAGTATVNVTVSCSDDPATAHDDSAPVAEDSGANTIDVRANDSDPDAANGGSKDLIADK